LGNFPQCTVASTSNQREEGGKEREEEKGEAERENPETGRELEVAVDHAAQPSGCCSRRPCRAMDSVADSELELSRAL
jgi:hypothetical protein